MRIVYCVVVFVTFLLCDAASTTESLLILPTNSYESSPVSIKPPGTRLDVLPQIRHKKRKDPYLDDSGNKTKHHAFSREITYHQRLSIPRACCKHQVGARIKNINSRGNNFVRSIQIELQLLYSLKHDTHMDHNQFLTKIYDMHQAKMLKFWFSFVWLILASKISLQFLLLLVKRCRLPMFTNWHVMLNGHSSLIEEYNRHSRLITLLPFKASSFDADWQFLGYAFLQEDIKLFDLILNLSSPQDHLPENLLLMTRALAVESVRPSFAVALKKYWPRAGSKVLETDITLQMLLLNIEAPLSERLKNGLFCSKTLNTIVASDRLDLLQHVLQCIDADVLLPEMFIWHCLAVHKRIEWFPIVKKYIHTAGINAKDTLGNTLSTLAVGNSQLASIIHSISTHKKH